ncbi:hypothetical protein MIND_00977800 [Mycena indigotica]|uniref:Uncharacterized protein n=1 Tax=Mycena indigotica TaxID=2126181 RepID=A0A8H6SEF9_9AGAR|nr:uncharacterized protein MIND_00977800 [Mycena indigotica]KAF7297442.1 hypothetical protein MIND_00977800 [Mycena indigotica]
MTEYDYSPEGQRRYQATQRRIANWVNQTASTPSLKSPFTPRSVVSSSGRTQSHPLAPATKVHSSSGTASHRKDNASVTTPPPPPPPPPTVYPSDSISQVSSRRSSHSSRSSRSHKSAGRSRHTSSKTHYSKPYIATEQNVRPSADGRSYIISPPPSPPGRSHGMIIFPQAGRAPHVVFY